MRNVSVLFNEPKLLKWIFQVGRLTIFAVSVLFNEPKLLKWKRKSRKTSSTPSFSALQRAEIAEIEDGAVYVQEIECFSALQRAEIAEIQRGGEASVRIAAVSVLFNEPKLLKSGGNSICGSRARLFQCSSTSRNC